jgi:hypothetical protein
MKENLILRQYETQSVNGTFEMKEFRWFFGSKMMEIEDMIIIDDTTIQYSEMSNGFQYYESESQVRESYSTPNLNQLKIDNHRIYMPPQSNIQKQKNTLWNLDIDMRTIIRNYLFYKIKEIRTFKGISQENILNKNINQSIKNYIDENILDRYRYKNIDLYVKYNNIEESQNVRSSNKLQFDVNFNTLVKKSSNLIVNYTTEQDSQNINNLKIKYNQVKPSETNNFDYYFDLFFEKI